MIGTSAGEPLRRADLARGPRQLIVLGDVDAVDIADSRVRRVELEARGVDRARRDRTSGRLESSCVRGVRHIVAIVMGIALFASASEAAPKGKPAPLTPELTRLAVDAAKAFDQVYVMIAEAKQLEATLLSPPPQARAGAAGDRRSGTVWDYTHPRLTTTANTHRDGEHATAAPT